MARKFTIAAKSGESAVRHMLVTYLNTSETAATPAWNPMGLKVTDSSINYDYNPETKKDILGGVYTTAQEPEMTQSLSGNEVVGGNEVMEHLLNLAVVEKNHAALVNQDCLIVHTYLKDTNGKAFAERYQGCAVLLTTDGGEGGGMLVSDIEITFGGTRTTGTASVGSDGTVTFTPDSD